MAKIDKILREKKGQMKLLTKGKDEKERVKTQELLSDEEILSKHHEHR